MDAEQKRRAERILSEWHDGKYSAARHGVEMASLLHELVDAAEEFESLTRNEDGTVSLKPGFKAVACTAQEALPAANPAQISSSAEPVMCPGCEGAPANPNNPCAVCGKKAPAPSVPDGWRPVPLSATVEMRNAGRAHLTGITSYADSMALKVYGAMVAAAPTPPEPPADVALDAGDLERLRMQLAACTTAALLNTRETMAERITADNPYYSAAYADVCRAVDREVEYREKLADVARDAERYRWLLENARATAEHWGGRWSLVIDSPAPGKDASSEAINAAIDAAINRQGGE